MSENGRGVPVVVLYDFVSQSSNELTVSAGQHLHYFYELNGWAFTRTQTGECGYIPLKYCKLKTRTVQEDEPQPVSVSVPNSVLPKGSNQVLPGRCSCACHHDSSAKISSTGNRTVNFRQKAVRKSNKNACEKRPESPDHDNSEEDSLLSHTSTISEDDGISMSMSTSSETSSVLEVSRYGNIRGAIAVKGATFRRSTALNKPIVPQKHSREKLHSKVSQEENQITPTAELVEESDSQSDRSVKSAYTAEWVDNQCPDLANGSMTGSEGSSKLKPSCDTTNVDNSSTSFPILDKRSGNVEPNTYLHGVFIRDHDMQRQSHTCSALNQPTIIPSYENIADFLPKSSIAQSSGFTKSPGTQSGNQTLVKPVKGKGSTDSIPLKIKHLVCQLSGGSQVPVWKRVASTGVNHAQPPSHLPRANGDFQTSIPSNPDMTLNKRIMTTSFETELPNTSSKKYSGQWKSETDLRSTFPIRSNIKTKTGKKVKKVVRFALADATERCFNQSTPHQTIEYHTTNGSTILQTQV